MKCPQCHAENEEGAERCASCGAPLHDAPQESQPSPTPAPPVRRRSVVGPAAVALIVIAVIVVLVARGRANTPAGCMNRFMSADVARRDEELKQFVAGDNPQKFLVDWLRVRTELGDSPFRSSHIFDVAPMGEDKAAVLVAITVPTRGKPGLRALGKQSRHNAIVLVNLTRENGQWKIIGAGMRAGVAKILVGCGYSALADLSAGAPGGKGPGGPGGPPKPGSPPSPVQAARQASP